MIASNDSDGMLAGDVIDDSITTLKQNKQENCQKIKRMSHE